MSYPPYVDYANDGVENIRWDENTDTYIGTLDKLPRLTHPNGFPIRSCPDVLPETVIEEQDEML